MLKKNCRTVCWPECQSLFKELSNADKSAMGWWWWLICILRLLSSVSSWDRGKMPCHSVLQSRDRKWSFNPMCGFIRPKADIQPPLQTNCHHSVHINYVQTVAKPITSRVSHKTNSGHAITTVTSEVRAAREVVGGRGRGRRPNRISVPSQSHPPPISMLYSAQRWLQRFSATMRDVVKPICPLPMRVWLTVII